MENNIHKIYGFSSHKFKFNSNCAIDYLLRPTRLVERERKKQKQIHKCFTNYMPFHLILPLLFCFVFFSLGMLCTYVDWKSVVNGEREKWLLWSRQSCK